MIVKTFSQYLKECKPRAINEGGGFGHLSSPHHVNYTLKDFKNIISHAFEGKLDKVAEKTDGQNIMISWKNGHIIASRNKGHQKNYGENALNKQGIYDMFAGRGELSSAFNDAVDDLEMAFSKLPNDKIDYLFKEGRQWLSLEIMTPKNENIIHYGLSELRIHGMIELGENGEPVAQLNQSYGRYIEKLLKEINANIQNRYEIKGLSKIQLDKVKNADTHISKANGKLSKLFGTFGLGENDTIDDYKSAWLRVNYLKKVELSDEVKNALINRWAKEDKSFSITKIYKLETPDKKKIIQALDKNSKKAIGRCLIPIDRVFLEVGTLVVQNIKTFMTVSPDKAIANIKSRMKDTSNKISNSGNQQLKDDLKKQIDRIQSIGGEESIMPSEGITFFYKGELLKLTGSFAAANQLINLSWRL